MSLCAALLEQQLEGVSDGVWVQERGDLLEDKEERERKYFNGKHAIKNNPLSYILFSSAN